MKQRSLIVSGLCLYVDDTRIPPEGWMVARDYASAIRLLQAHNFVEVSLDHDLACFSHGREWTGYDILSWLVQRKMNKQYVPACIRVHSANPVASEKMNAVIAKHFQPR